MTEQFLWRASGASWVAGNGDGGELSAAAGGGASEGGGKEGK